MSDLHYLSACEALARFRDRSLSPVELMEATIERAEAVEPTVNAFSHTRYDEARAQAAFAEARFAPRSAQPPRPLEGIPLAIKEEEPITGQPWTQGSLLFKERVADHTSAFAQRMVDSGAIVHARTTVPEFSCAAFTHSRINGVTRNPWNPEMAVGGSSGGSGAALAAGTTVLASGSDIGGSIRAPASFCGVVGFKPPYGRVPVPPPFNLDTYCHCGPLARTVADAALFQNQIAGPDPSDVASLRPKLVLPERFETVDGLRIAFSPNLGSWPLDHEVASNAAACADALRAAGAIVDAVDLCVPRDRALRACEIHFHHGFAALIGDDVAGREDEVTGYALEFVRRMAERTDGATFVDGLMLEAELYAPVGALLQDYDALLCATVGTRGLIAGDDYADHGLQVGDQHVDYYLDAYLTPVFNIMSRCPVLNVPSGFAENGVPTGLQIVGRTYDDATVFRIGAALAAARPWLDAPERRPSIAALPKAVS